MWLLTIYKYNHADSEQLFVYDYKKDLVKDLKKLGFKYSKLDDTYYNKKLGFWTWIEKIEKNKIELLNFDR